MLHQVQTWRAMWTDACRKRITCTVTRTITRATNITVDYQQIAYGNVANQIHGFTM